MNWLRFNAFFYLILVLWPVGLLTGTASTTVWMLGVDDTGCAAVAIVVAIFSLAVGFRFAAPTARELAGRDPDVVERGIVFFACVMLVWMVLVGCFMAVANKIQPPFTFAALVLVAMLLFGAVASLLAFSMLGTVACQGSTTLLKYVPVLNIVGAPGVAAARIAFPALVESLPPSGLVDVLTGWAQACMRVVKRVEEWPAKKGGGA